ncbi:hypothetical protein EVAR_65122_1 [Eumeta japonica]|uniref:Very-long-chain 3-oxoacyl-CoA synthase n=1 Tax=Eumeta variegata TaxID=151549 RepID=A0A4C1Z4E2_EUMVA|nr:hypothetical protein EVAR_65122_1 [Eumeta japonica]
MSGIKTQFVRFKLVVWFQVQFILVLWQLHYQRELSPCPVPAAFHWFCMSNIAFFFALFLKFYFGSYQKRMMTKGKQKIDKKQNLMCEQSTLRRDGAVNRRVAAAVGGEGLPSRPCRPRQSASAHRAARPRRLRPRARPRFSSSARASLQTEKFCEQRGNNNTVHTERGRNTESTLSKTKYRQRRARARQRVRWLNPSTGLLEPVCASHCEAAPRSPYPALGCE